VPISITINSDNPFHINPAKLETLNNLVATHSAEGKKYQEGAAMNQVRWLGKIILKKYGFFSPFKKVRMGVTYHVVNYAGPTF
jgi:hypothetical protein